jgi:predicted metal-dependent HD superfamily phosphohydrolase
MNPFKTFEKQLKYAFSDNCIKELQNLWSSKTRFYHNADHLISIIENIEKTPSFKELNLYEKNALLYAAFFHDAIYDPKKKDNEDKSIEYFKHSFKPNDIKTVEVVC